MVVGLCFLPTLHVHPVYSSFSEDLSVVLLLPIQKRRRAGEVQGRKDAVLPLYLRCCPGVSAYQRKLQEKSEQLTIKIHFNEGFSQQKRYLGELAGVLSLSLSLSLSLCVCVCVHMCVFTKHSNTV